MLRKEIVRKIRVERIRQAQDEEKWIANLKTYLIRDLAKLDADEAKASAAIAPDYEVDEKVVICMQQMKFND